MRFHKAKADGAAKCVKSRVRVPAWHFAPASPLWRDESAQSGMCCYSHTPARSRKSTLRLRARSVLENTGLPARDRAHTRSACQQWTKRGPPATRRRSHGSPGPLRGPLHHVPGPTWQTVNLPSPPTAATTPVAHQTLHQPFQAAPGSASDLRPPLCHRG